MTRINSTPLNNGGSVSYVPNAGNSALLGGQAPAYYYPSASITTASVAYAASAGSVPSKYYGSFYDTTTQAAPSANTAYAITMNTTDLSYGVTVNSSSITFAHAGIYNVQFSAQMADTGTANFDIWLSKNGQYIPNSDSTISVSNQNRYAVPSWNFFLNLNANDVIQFYWASTSNSGSVLYTSSAVGAPYHPAIPSIIVTAVQI